MATKIQLDQIETNDELQARANKLNGTVVYEYADNMKEGDVFPAIVVFYDGERYYLADGFHRVAAARRIGATEILADVREGAIRDAILYANGPANKVHGLQLTTEDKRNRVARMLQDDEWSQWSDRKIAKHCGVSHTFVALMRERLAAQSGNVATKQDWSTAGYAVAFWNQVKKLELDSSTVLEQLQPGAKALSDLNMTKEECWQKLSEMGVQRLATRHPVDSTVVHLATKRVGRVTGHSVSSIGLALKVFDLKQEVDEEWLADGIAAATQYAIDAYLKPAAAEQDRPLSVTDVVITRSGHIGFVRHINGAFNIITTVNGEQPHYRQDLTLIDLTDGALPKTLTEQQRTEFKILSAKQLAEWNERDADTQPEPEPNPFQVGDRVQWKDDGRGNGTIRYIKGEKCGVYADASHTTHYYHWSELERETGNVATKSPTVKLTIGDDKETEISPAEDRLYMLLHNFGWKETEQLSVALEHIMLYLNGLYPFTEEIHTNVAVWREFLDRVDATCNAEHEQVAS